MPPAFKPIYRKTPRATLIGISRTLNNMLRACSLCPRQCNVDRIQGYRGYCNSGTRIKIASATLHFGEEPPLSGTRGSGAVFFTGCTMRCVYCQNYPISQLYNGNEISDEGLANEMVGLQKRGAHNINLVTATHYLPSFMRSLILAIDQGLSIPLVYNSSGYETSQTLSVLRHIIDIYMPDAKYASSITAHRYSDARDYPSVNRAAISIMHEQVGDLQLDNSGIACRGLLVRHLVLPGSLSDTRKVLGFLRSISPDIHVSLMSQYHPAHNACHVKNLKRSLTRNEYRLALEFHDNLGFTQGWKQPL
jgi:putative pyruvate formate lyase activating enzyme